MKRPFGLILATIFLGFAGLCLSVAGLFTLFGALGINHIVPASTSAGAPPAFLAAVLMVTALIELLLAAWVISTLIGLLRLRNWARHSVIVLGALLTLFGGASALVMAVMPRLLARTPQPHPLPLNVMHGLFVALALFYVFVAAVGISWLVYFNLRSVKNYFLPQYTANTLAPYPYPTAQLLATPGGLAYPPPPPPPSPAFAPARPSRFSNLPVPITIIACFLLFGALCCAVIACLPLPGFAFGFILTGLPDHILYAALALVSLLIGIGLMRLDDRARLAAFALLGLAAVNVALTLTPHYPAAMVRYQDLLRQSMHFPTLANQPPIQLVDPNSLALLIPGVVFSVAVYGAAAWALHRYRAAFHR